MAGKSIYPSIPSPGADAASQRATLDAMRQTLTMITMNAQNPNPNFAPSTASQIFVTKDDLKSGGLMGAQGPAGPQGPPGPGIAEAPNDTNIYGRHGLTWQSMSVSAGMVTPLSVLSSPSQTYLMQGFGLTLVLGLATRVWLAISGNISNSVNNAETDVQLYYGTGTPPANGAAVTGTAIGSPVRYEASTGGSVSPFSRSVLISGLTPGITYWFDAAMRVTSGNGSISELALAAHGLI